MHGGEGEAWAGAGLDAHHPSQGAPVAQGARSGYGHDGSVGAYVMYGSGECGIRTRDLRLARAALSHLS